MEKGRFVLYIYRKRFRTVFVVVGPPLNKFFSQGVCLSIKWDVFSL
jgi:hypothetical protein